MENFLGAHNLVQAHEHVQMANLARETNINTASFLVSFVAITDDNNKAKNDDITPSGNMIETTLHTMSDIKCPKEVATGVKAKNDNKNMLISDQKALIDTKPDEKKFNF